MLVRRFRWMVLTVTLGISVGCGPMAVVHGPESCQMARTYESSFGPDGRGNVFRFRADTAGVGLITREGQLTALKTIWTVDGDVREGIPSGTSLRVALGGEVLELEVGRDATPVGHERAEAGTGSAHVQEHYETLTTWSVLSVVNDATLMALGQARVEAIQLQLPNGRHEMPVPEDIGARLQTLAICLRRATPTGE